MRYASRLHSNRLVNPFRSGTQIGEIKKKKSNFLTLPEFLRVLNHLIENGRVLSVAWSPDGNCMASGSNDKTIKVWNTKTGQCQSTLTVDSPVYSVAFSPDGTKLASGSYDRTVRIWSVGSAGTFECQSPLSGHSDW